MKIDTKHFKKVLEEERDKLKTELASIGRINPDNPGDWEAAPDERNVTPADENEVADTIESYEENTAILKQLEIRFNEVEKALKRIEEDQYGICEVGGEEIEEERLKANPAATSCISHMQK
ncbi:MAG: RNA polymerase-binding protein DksA [Parcubacteria group bacterium CG11_big_fil_rev_8_21_14_0_20_39_22]|nr:MAG: RNA polymerase-binding protein DksA [Parcubacteria group bacterium CG11_big_fil_rev_8_21_14_0_20_39_22]